ncbi:conserved hypothetical protein [delta proteobacterium NaphS2]|nr:conserved hypothetical protein [delta proteobacterium NaphS2]
MSNILLILTNTKNSGKTNISLQECILNLKCFINVNFMLKDRLGLPVLNEKWPFSRDI